jgi:hypothetical protein
MYVYFFKPLVNYSLLCVFQVKVISYGEFNITKDSKKMQNKSTSTIQ